MADNIFELRPSSPSINSMTEGEIIFARHPRKGLCLYTRQGNQLWMTELNRLSSTKKIEDITVNGVSNFRDRLNARDIIVDKLKYNKLTHYQTFIHNFSDDTGTDLHYIPWGSYDEGTNMRTSDDYLTPFKMTLKKILFKTGRIDDLDANPTFTLARVKDGNTGTDEIGFFEYREKLMPVRFISIYDTDFVLNPPYESLSIEPNEKVGISIKYDSDPMTGVAAANITSIWEVEIDLS